MVLLRLRSADKKFLDFFFQRVEPNSTGRYTNEFPFISRCGRELNFLRCDDTPLVYHTLIPKGVSLTSDNDELDLYVKAHTDGDGGDAAAAADGDGVQAWEFVYGGTLRRQFEPSKLCMTDTARLYHPSPDGKDLYLVASPLAIKLSRLMDFGQDNTRFTWQGKSYDIDIRITDDDEASKS